MKKISAIILILFLGTFTVSAQGHSQGAVSPQSPNQTSQDKSSNPDALTKLKYSEQNLKGASLEQLNYQLIKAKNLRTTGIVLSILGPAAAIGGLAAINNNIFESTGVLFVTGFLTTVAAIPIKITGSYRLVNIEDEIIKRDRNSIVNIVFYSKARSMRGIGSFLTFAGPVAFATAYLLDLNDNSTSTPMYIAGAISTGVGIPLYIVGSQRVNKIVGGLTTHDAASLNIAPSFVYNNKTRNLYPGLTLRVRF